MSAPYIPFYIDDFDGATAHLSASEEGIYMRLIKLAWRTPRCELPNDVAFIARKCRSTEGEIDPVLREFFRLTRGRWVQARLKREYDKLADKKRERSEAGKIGGMNRALKYKENVSSKAIVLLKQPEPEPEPEPIIKISAKKGSRFDGAGIDTLPPEWLFYCQSHGVPEKVSYSEFTKFSNYWSSKTGSGATKLDWGKTWQNWILTVVERNGYSPHTIEDVDKSILIKAYQTSGIWHKEWGERPTEQEMRA